MNKKRSRLIYGMALLPVIALGLFSRSSAAEGLPALFTVYAGDTCWALSLYLFVCILFPSMAGAYVCLMTVMLSFAVEFSQLYQAEWIDAVRATRPGGLLLGFGFKGSDLVCYLAGALTGWAADTLLRLFRPA